MNGRGKAAVVAAALFSGTPAGAQAVNVDLIRGGIEQLINSVLALSSEAGSAATVEQSGFTSRAFIAQAGPFNSADVNQAGIMMSGIALPNLAVIGQAGAMGRADISQAGTGNIAAANQDQSTQLATSLIEQNATFNNGATLQRGLGSYSQITQSGGLLGIGAHIALVKQLDGSISTVAQQGSEHLVLVDQAGFGNESDISQRDIGNETGDEVILTAGVFQTGVDNISKVEQDADGAGSFASVIQAGADNESLVRQSDASEALLYQAGTRNVSEVTQASGSSGSLADVDQLGDRDVSHVAQNAGDNVAMVLQDRGSADAASDLAQGGGTGNFAMLVQSADARSFINQFGSLNYAMVIQAAAGDVSTVRQNGTGNQADVRQ